jgi:hypothetical protein
MTISRFGEGGVLAGIGYPSAEAGTISGTVCQLLSVFQDLGSEALK